MANTPLPDFVTRPEAAKLYNRSQRALERDLDVALAIRDEEVLEQFKLVTKDDAIRDASNLSIDVVKELVADGMSPTWYVSEAWLDRRYGRKGTPKPRITSAHPQQDEHSPRTSNKHHSTGTVDGASDETVRAELRFLTQQLETLQREKSQEQDRHDRIVAKLFDQLDVKDKQISAWDEVTQGLTRGLATGQLTPNLLTTASAGVTEPVMAQGPTRNVEVSASKSTASSVQTKRSHSSKVKRVRRRPIDKSAAKKKKAPAPQTLFEKHTPTLHRAFKGVFGNP